MGPITGLDLDLDILLEHVSFVAGDGNEYTERASYPTVLKIVYNPAVKDGHVNSVDVYYKDGTRKKYFRLVELEFKK